MKISYYGHSGFRMEAAGVSLVFDPFISPNENAKSIDVSSIQADYVFLSHGHIDHVFDAEAIARQNNAIVVSNYEIATYYGKKGLKHHPMNTGGQKDFGPFQVKTVNAVHSSVLPDGTYGGNPMGFIITIESRSFYYSGDTALTLDMQLIGMYHQIDTAFICIGDNFTMGAEDAIRSAQMIKTKKVIGMHFDTFPYIVIQHQETIELFRKEGIELTLPTIGQTFEI